MRIKIDENLPQSLATALNRMGHDADTVEQEGLRGHSDQNVWTAAKTEGRFLITQDLDFSDIRKFVPMTHPGIMLLRLEWPDYSSVIRRVSQVFTTEDVSKWAGCLIVVTEDRVRVRNTAAD